MTLNWFDAHLDLAYMAEVGRDMTAEPESAGGQDLPAGVTFPSLHDGRVTHALGTIFTEADGDPRCSHTYQADDADAANAAGLRQLKRYRQWGTGHFYRRQLAGDPAAVIAPPARDEAPDVLVLIEGADPILDPADLPEWRAEGVVAIGLAWWKPSRYAGGNGSATGLTDAGRSLVKAMDALGVVHDASHLSDRSFADLCELSDKPIIASHSNCRSLVGGGGFGENQRHLRDDQIRTIVERGGIVGINLYSKFLNPKYQTPEDGRASIDEVVGHIRHICDLAGDRRHVGLGSDMDGGFSAARLPMGIDRPRDLNKIADALSAAGWSDAEIAGFAFDNWARFWGLTPGGHGGAMP